MTKRRGSRSKIRAVASKQVSVLPMSQKISIVVKNLIGFVILFLISFILFKVASAAFWNDLFFLLMLVFGFVGLAFFIVWLVLLYLKASGR